MTSAADAFSNDREPELMKPQAIMSSAEPLRQDMGIPAGIANPGVYVAAVLANAAQQSIPRGAEGAAAPAKVLLRGLIRHRGREAVAKIKNADWLQSVLAIGPGGNHIDLGKYIKQSFGVAYGDDDCPNANCRERHAGMILVLPICRESSTHVAATASASQGLMPRSRMAFV